MSPTADIQIRPATPGDKEFLVSLLPRLVEFGPPPWRDVAQMMTIDREVLCKNLSAPSPGIAIFIAEDVGGAALGFIHLVTLTDYYTREEHGHISDVVVAPDGEGRGIARALMTKGEEWARSKGYRWLTLSVFARN
ncbi:MAG: GNAT family N-acetyltransferase, partial [Acidobacteria bacterium]|nr:GNAT family N-acetyltransferase [Acidobacteriota bacterium]